MAPFASFRLGGIAFFAQIRVWFPFLRGNACLVFARENQKESQSHAGNRSLLEQGRAVGLEHGFFLADVRAGTWHWSRMVRKKGTEVMLSHFRGLVQMCVVFRLELGCCQKSGFCFGI